MAFTTRKVDARSGSGDTTVPSPAVQLARKLLDETGLTVDDPLHLAACSLTDSRLGDGVVVPAGTWDFGPLKPPVGPADGPGARAKLGMSTERSDFWRLLVPLGAPSLLL